jgi:hypothetical protein
MSDEIFPDYENVREVILQFDEYLFVFATRAVQIKNRLQPWWKWIL